MKNKLLLFIIALFCVVNSHAEKVTIENAEKVARSYASRTPRLQLKTNNIQLSRTVFKELKSNNPLKNSQEEAMYYVFSMSNNEGFIIVSADDVAVPVLGYSDQGSYDESNPNLSYWMGSLTQEIASAIENGIPQSAEIKAKWDAYLSGDASTLRASNAVVVNPLVQTLWDQGAPYNTLCPSGAATGCAATAMAQIMKYWNYPTTGTGSHSYTPSAHPEYGVQSANFGNTTYNWANMTNMYTSSSTQAQNTAVATLMYHCGVSIDMDYAPPAEGSSATTGAVVSALVNYFKYDAGINYLERDYYSYTNWVNILQAELNASRPIFYTGQGSLGGHAFVCDGYDSNNLFHFNWGWSGLSNGYFELSALNPPVLGIGGGAGGFNSLQAIVVGIQPNVGGTPPGIRLGLSAFYSDSTSLPTVTTLFSVTMENITNLSAVSLNPVTLGGLLYKEDGTLVGTLPFYNYNVNNGELTTGSWFPSITLLNFKLPSGLAAGTYRLYGAFSTTPAPTVTPFKMEGVNGDRYIRVVVAANGTVTLTTVSAISPVLSLVSLSAVGNLYQNITGRFTATITNSGTGDYSSNLTIKLGTYTILTDPVVIPAGTTKTINFSSPNPISLPPSTRNLTIWYDPANNQSTPSVQLGSSSVSVVIQATPAAPNLSVASFSFPNGSTFPANAPSLSAGILNTGGIYDGGIYIYITAAGSTSFLSALGPQNATIEQGATTTVLFNDPIALPAGNYWAFVFSDLGQVSSYYSFTLTAPVYPSSTSSNVPMVIAGDVYINGLMRSEGAVHVLAATAIDTGKINIAATSGAALVTDTIILYSNDTSDGLLRNLNTTGVRGITVAAQPNKVIVRKTFLGGNHTYMSLPFTVTAANIFAAGTTTPALTAFTDYGAWGFDAQQRATYQGFTSAVWVKTSTGLTKGKGYQFQYGVDGAVDFVGTDPAEINSLFANANKDLSYDKYMITSNPLSNPTQEAMDAGWAFIGGLNSTTFALKQVNVGGYDGGTIYYRNTKNSQSSNTMQHDGYTEFVFGKDDLGALAANVGPYTPFYIQGAVTGSGTLITQPGTFTYNSSGVILDGTVAFRSSNDESGPEKDQLYFALSSDKDKSFDRFYLSFADNYTESYRGIEDAMKMTTAFDGRPTVWSLLDGVDQALVVNGLPMKDGREVRMGFSVPEGGDYTIALEPLRRQDVKNVILLDNVTGKKVDLLQSPYSFNTGAVEGENGRFVLYINGSYTGTPSVGSEDIYAYAKDNLLTVKNLSAGDRVQVMDLAGRIVAAGNASGKEFSVALSQKGVYVVNVTGVKTSVLKVLNK